MHKKPSRRALHLIQMNDLIMLSLYHKRQEDESPDTGEAGHGISGGARRLKCLVVRTFARARFSRIAHPSPLCQDTHRLHTLGLPFQKPVSFSSFHPLHRISLANSLPACLRSTTHSRVGSLAGKVYVGQCP